MVEEVKETEKKEVSNKDKQNKKRKIKKYIFIVLISLLVIGLVAVILSYILLYDNNKNTHKDNQNNNAEIIRKNFVDGFKDTSSSGIFSFLLPSDDVNQMLMNAYKVIGDTSIESIYYEEKGSFQYFYVDLPRNCMVPSRVVIETYVSNVSNYKVELKINKISKGKINIIDKCISKGYLSANYVSNISKYSLLPISYLEDKQAFLVDVLSLMEYFPKGDIKDSIYSVIALNKEKYISYGTSLFSFNVDFRSLRSNEYLSSKPLESVENLENSLIEKATNFDSSTIAVGEETTLYEVSMKSFSNIVSSEIDSSTKETYSSSLTSNVAIFEIKYIHAVIETDKVKYMINISINGYEIDISINSGVVGTYSLYRINLNLDKGIKVGNIDIDESSDITKLYKSYLIKIFSRLANKYTYFTYYDESKIYGLDLSSIETTVIRPDLLYQNITLVPGKFCFGVQRVF